MCEDVLVFDFITTRVDSEELGILESPILVAQQHCSRYICLLKHLLPAHLREKVLYQTSAYEILRYPSKWTSPQGLQNESKRRP